MERPNRKEVIGGTPAMRRRRKLWVVLADGERARFVTRASNLAFHTVHTIESPSSHKRTSDLGSDRPGRFGDRATAMRHVIDPKHDLHEMEKQRFAQVVAREIDRVSAEGGFDHLVVVAPAHTLNQIRDGLGAAAVAKVVGTLQKDLTKVPDHELPQHLTEWVRYRAEQQNGRRRKTADRVRA